MKENSHLGADIIRGKMIEKYLGKLAGNLNSNEIQAALSGDKREYMNAYSAIQKGSEYALTTLFFINNEAREISLNPNPTQSNIPKLKELIIDFNGSARKGLVGEDKGKPDPIRLPGSHQIKQVYGDISRNLAEISGKGSLQR